MKLVGLIEMHTKEFVISSHLCSMSTDHSPKNKTITFLILKKEQM